MFLHIVFSLTVVANGVLSSVDVSGIKTAGNLLVNYNNEVVKLRVRHKHE